MNSISANVERNQECNLHFSGVFYPQKKSSNSVHMERKDIQHQKIIFR